MLCQTKKSGITLVSFYLNDDNFLPILLSSSVLTPAFFTVIMSTALPHDSDLKFKKDSVLTKL